MRKIHLKSVGRVVLVKLLHLWDQILTSYKQICELFTIQYHYNARWELNDKPKPITFQTISLRGLKLNKKGNPLYLFTYKKNIFP
jgi:hypothetical protein